MYGYIYETVNLVNGKKYIGKKTSKSFLGENYLGSGIYLNRAVKKYGRNNFKVRLLETIDTNQKDLCEREIFWIDYYNAIDSDKFYNIGAGGIGWNNSVNFRKGNNHWLGKHHTEDSRKKMSNSHRGKHLSEKHKKSLSKAQKIAQLGSVKSKETRDKISESLKNSLLCKNRRWYNNGIKCILTNNPPEGYVLGRLYKTVRPKEILYK